MCTAGSLSCDLNQYLPDIEVNCLTSYERHWQELKYSCNEDVSSAIREHVRQKQHEQG